MGAVLDLESLPSGRRYEDQYGAWLDIFRRVAEAEVKPVVAHAPCSWAPLLYYLGASVLSVKEHFAEDRLTDYAVLDLQAAEARNMLREKVEMFSVLRPELVDALYKSDVEWRTIGRRHPVMKKVFNVTCNGSFFRPEVMEYLNETLPAFVMGRDKCVLVPCAADKPYPAPMHKAVRAHIPDDYEIIIATGVLGLVPESFWYLMPLYDSGLPYQWRLMQVVADFFGKHRYRRVVVYSDFYASAIKRGMREANMGPPTVSYVFPPVDGLDYQDLMSDMNLKLLWEMTR